MDASGDARRRRQRAVRRYVAAVAVAGAVGAAWALNEAVRGGADLWFGVAIGVAVSLAHAGHLRLGSRPDGFGYTSEDLVVTAALVAAPADVGYAIPVLVLGLAPALRFLGVTQRLRDTTTTKLVFKVGAGAVSMSVALLAVTLTPLGPVAAGLVGGSVHFLMTALVSAVAVSCADGRGFRTVLFELAPLAPLAAGSVVAGAALGIAATATAWPHAWILSAAAAVYAYAHASIRLFIRQDAERRLLDAAPGVFLAQDVTLDESILDVARELIGTEHAVFAPVPAAAGQMSVPIAAPDGGEEHLVVWGRLGDHQRFDREDRELLAGLARLAGPSRQQRRLVDELRRSEESRAAIVGALAHDLRSPLATAGTGLATARRFIGELDPERLTRVLESAHRGVDRSLAILDDLLALERAHLAPSDATSADVVEVAQATAEAHDGDVRVGTGPPVAARIDDRILARILDNLVSNAAKHAPGSEIRLDWSVAADEVTIRVDDDGSGIPPELRDRITGAFQQGAGATSGVGLGLYLARRFAELAGGRIVVGDSPSGGASIGVVLPLVSSSVSGLAAS